MKALDLLVLNLLGFSQARKLWLRLKQDHGCHVGAVDCVNEVSIPIQSIANKLQRDQLVRERRIQRLQFVPFSSGRLGIVEIVHDLDDVGIVSAMEFKMVLCLQLRRRPFEVVVEGEWRTVEVVSMQRAIDAFLMAQGRCRYLLAENRSCERKSGGSGS